MKSPLGQRRTYVPEGQRDVACFGRWDSACRSSDVKYLVSYRWAMAQGGGDCTSWRGPCSSSMKARCLRFCAAWLCKEPDSGVELEDGAAIGLNAMAAALGVNISR